MINSCLNNNLNYKKKQIIIYYFSGPGGLIFNFLNIINIFYTNKNKGRSVIKFFKSYQFIFNLYCWCKYNFLWGLFYNLKFFSFLLLNYVKFFFKKQLHKKLKKAGRSRAKFKLEYNLNNYNLKYAYLNNYFKLYINNINMHYLSNRLTFLILFMLQPKNILWYKRRLILYKNLYDQYSSLVLK